MIPDNELRIGNAIMWHTGMGDPVYGKVYEVRADTVAIAEPTQLEDGGTGQGFMKLSGIHPIPIGHENVLRCGFEFYKDEKINQYERRMKFAIGEDDEFQVHFIYSNYGGKRETEIAFLRGNGQDYITWINSVHELQNIFFLVAKKELTITQ